MEHKGYRIRDWDKLYENNRSRRVKDLQWVPIPNRHDGDRYVELMSRPDAATVFAAWILMLEVASRCTPRGTLVRSDGQPHDAASLAARTRGKPEWFELALPVLAQLTWIEPCTPQRQQGDAGGAPAREKKPHRRPSQRRKLVDERKKERRKEGMERKKEESAPPASTPKASQFEIPTTEQAQTLAIKLGMHADQGRAFWTHYQAQGWVTGSGLPCADWKALLHRWKTKWERETVASNTNGNGVHPEFRSALDAKIVVEQCAKDIQKLREDDASYVQIPEPPFKRLNDSARAQFAHLKDRKKRAEDFITNSTPKPS